MDQFWYVILFAGVFVINVVIPNTLIKVYENKMINALKEGNYEVFYKTANKKIVSYLCGKFNIEYLKLQAALLEENHEKIETQYNYFDSKKLSEAQKEVIYVKAFNYYVTMHNDEKIEYYLEKIKTLKNKNIVKEIEITYDVVVKKQCTYLNDVLESYEKANDKIKPGYAYLLSLMYKYQGDNKQSKFYERIANKNDK